jgi:hypothetical protein
VSIEAGIALAQKLDVPFFEACAKTSINVKESVHKLLWEIIYEDKRMRGLSYSLPQHKKKNCSLI